MTKQTRRKFSAEFKAKVALEAIKNQKTLAQLSQQYQVNPITIYKWKADTMENMSVIFKGNHNSGHRDPSAEMEKLYVFDYTESCIFKIGTMVNNNLISTILRLAQPYPHSNSAQESMLRLRSATGGILQRIILSAISASLKALFSYAKI